MIRIITIELNNTEITIDLESVLMIEIRKSWFRDRNKIIISFKNKKKGDNFEIVPTGNGKYTHDELNQKIRGIYKFLVQTWQNYGNTDANSNNTQSITIT